MSRKGEEMTNKRSQNEYIKSAAIETGTCDGYEYWIVQGRCMNLRSIDRGLNGYIVFPKRPTIEESYNGILIYVPVHGGITYAEQCSLGMVYGFDTAHCDSKDYPINDHEWIKGQIKVMLKGILKAAEVERLYLRCKTNSGKAKHANKVLAIAPDMPHNMGVNINLLCGRL